MDSRSRRDWGSDSQETYPSKGTSMDSRKRDWGFDSQESYPRRPSEEWHRSQMRRPSEEWRKPLRSPTTPKGIIVDSRKRDWGFDSQESRLRRPSESSLRSPPSPGKNITITSTNTLQQIPTARSELSKPSPPMNKRTNSSISIRDSPTMRRHRAGLGLQPSAPLWDEHAYDQRQELLWSRIRATLREPFSEFLGVVVLMLFGNGSVAQVLLSTGETAAPGGNGFGPYQSINWGWGIGVMLGIYVAGDSGAYLNPAVTLSSCLYRQLPWRRFPVYFIAQLLGGMVGSAIVYANYVSAIDFYEGGRGIRTVPPAPKATAGIFCTYPQAFLSNGTQFVDEFVASAILMFVIFALKDRANNGVSKSDKWFPLMLFFLIWGIGACFGWQTGYAINLVRDFGPRLVSYGLGYGSEVWSAGNYYFWIPMVAPFLGCAFGGFLYDLFIYTGQSPVNSPYMGLGHLLHPMREIRAKTEAQKQMDMV